MDGVSGLRNEDTKYLGPKKVIGVDQQSEFACPKYCCPQMTLVVRNA